MDQLNKLPAYILFGISLFLLVFGGLLLFTDMFSDEIPAMRLPMGALLLIWSLLRGVFTWQKYGHLFRKK